jgi:hypothetical protein
MIQTEDNTTLITNGILITDGDLKSQVTKLLHHMILILTFKVHIMTMMILEQVKITGLEWEEDHGDGNQSSQKQSRKGQMKQRKQKQKKMEPIN